MRDYDVIVVGGRPAGATLAARLGQAGLRVLLLERATMPSLPGASSPIIYASTMRLLDEIGAEETAYAHNTPKIRRMLNATPGMQTEMRIPRLDGRDYAYAIDRARFDAALWNTASQTVEARDGVAVTDVLRDGQRVAGVVTSAGEQITADVVIGADGRFSLIARKVGAAEYDVHDQYPTSIYYAYWRGAKPFAEPTALAFGQEFGVGYLVMDSADDTKVIAIEGRTELLEPEPGKANQFYESLIRQHAFLAEIIDGAERITEVRGMRRIGNLYRQAGGAGWALVGDAYHQKDPIDGQGLYDAVFTAKQLAEAILEWKHGAKLWGEALAAYDAAVRRHTYPMYSSTLERVRTSLYEPAPAWAQTPVRWLLQDPLTMERFGLMLTRQIDADRVMTPTLMLGALLRGPLRDLSRFLDKESKR
ncbi:MAG: NAD(P)/FAD-dependent oxidoreductase [Chloroflexi bacterium]|nr:NAD(P)/FAD-dependent oxidoreductase [Chloroflexota bacterium]